MASRALMARLTSAEVSWLRSTSAGQALSLNAVSISICLPSVGASSLTTSSINALTSVSSGRSGCFLAKGQQVRRELRRPVGGVIDHLGDRGQRRIMLDAVGQDLDRAGDHGEHVVEVMGDAAGQLPDRFHLLRLEQLLFGGALCGDVPDERR
jgi:hypothetical protein